MNDNHDDPYAAPEPERFEPNVLRPEPEAIAPPVSAYAPEPVEPVAPPPLMVVDPMPSVEPAIAVAAPAPEARMALDGTSLTVNKVDGRTFDSSRERGEPATFPLPRLIKGWQEGVPMMKKGETWEFVIPAELAYGDRNRDPIPNGSTLLFEIELVDIPPEG